MGNIQNNEDSDLILVNVVESLIKLKTKELMKTIEMCQCEKCYLDACAIALNNTAPLYITTSKGRLLSTLSTINSGYQIEQMVEVFKALKMVSESPRHK